LIGAFKVSHRYTINNRRTSQRESVSGIFRRSQRLENPSAIASVPPAGMRAPKLDGRLAITLRGTDLEAQIARFKDMAAQAGYECSLAFTQILERTAQGEFGTGCILHAASGEKRACADVYLMRCGPGAHDFTLQRLVIFTNDPVLIRLAEECGGTVAL